MQTKTTNRTKSATKTENRLAQGATLTPKTAKTKPANATPEPAQPKLEPARSTRQPSREDIARRAYEIFVARGKVHGRANEDWIQAECELLGMGHRNN